MDYGPLRTDAFRKRVHGLVSGCRSTRGAIWCQAAHCLERCRICRWFLLCPDAAWRIARDDMPIMREDFFGPVLCVRAVRDADEAVALANANPNGIGRKRVDAGHQAGQANCGATAGGRGHGQHGNTDDGTRPGLPFGGMGASGWGRQRGAAGLDEFVQWKTVCWQGKVGAQRHVFPYRDATMPILRGLIALENRAGRESENAGGARTRKCGPQWNRLKTTSNRLMSLEQSVISRCVRACGHWANAPWQRNSFRCP